MEGEDRFNLATWLVENWNYFLAAIIFFAFVNYDAGLSQQASAGNEMLYLLTVLPVVCYLVYLHPLIWADDE
jgi:hypothetical protein